MGMIIVWDLSTFIMMNRLRAVKNVIGSQFGSSKETVFDLILSKKLPSKAIYEDELIYAFADVMPQAPVHVLIIPKDKDGLIGISQVEEP